MVEIDITLIADDDYFRVSYHEKSSLLYILWKTQLEGALFIEKYTTLLALIRRFKPKGLLGDTREVSYTTVEDSRWICKYFLPALLDSTVRRYARLESPQSLPMLHSWNLQNWVKCLPKENMDSFRFKIFTNEKSAMDWVDSD